jgi:hypothetical protein
MITMIAMMFLLFTNAVSLSDSAATDGLTAMFHELFMTAFAAHDAVRLTPPDTMREAVN